MKEGEEGGGQGKCQDHNIPVGYTYHQYRLDEGMRGDKNKRLMVVTETDDDELSVVAVSTYSKVSDDFIFTRERGGEVFLYRVISASNK